MPTMSDRQSVAANTTVSTVLQNKTYEFLPFRARVTLYGTASAVGLNFSFLANGVAVVDDQEVNAQNRLPLVPDDAITSEIFPTGTRLQLRYRNTTGAAITAFSKVDVQPV